MDDLRRIFITKEKTAKTLGRFNMIRNCNDFKPYVEYHIMWEKSKDDAGLSAITLDKKREVCDYCLNIPDFVKINGFNSVQEFTKHYKRDFNGYYQLANTR